MKKILLKRIDEYMLNFFNEMTVIEDNGNLHPKVNIIWADLEETKNWAFRQADRYVNSHDAVSFMTKARLPVIGVIRKHDTIGDVSLSKDFRYFEPSKVNIIGDGHSPKVVYEVNILSGLYEHHHQIMEQVFLKLTERPNWKVTKEESMEGCKNLKITIEADLKGL